MDRRCDVPLETNGEFVCSSQLVDLRLPIATTCTLSCNNGFEPNGNVETTCTVNPENQFDIQFFDPPVCRKL